MKGSNGKREDATLFRIQMRTFRAARDFRIAALSIIRPLVEKVPARDDSPVLVIGLT